jgi:hypothetical protein
MYVFICLFLGIQGFNVRINARGEAEGRYVVFGLAAPSPSSSPSGKAQLVPHMYQVRPSPTKDVES